jgi:transposase
LGREVLVATVAGGGEAPLYKGSALKSDYFYFERRFTRINRALSDPRRAARGVLAGERRRLYERRKRRRDQTFASAASHVGGLGVMARGLEALGIEAELPERIKVLSFLATPSGVKPINP